MAVWFSEISGSGVAHTNEVTLRRANRVSIRMGDRSRVNNRGSGTGKRLKIDGYMLRCV